MDKEKKPVITSLLNIEDNRAVRIGHFPHLFGQLLGAEPLFIVRFVEPRLRICEGDWNPPGQLFCVFCLKYLYD